VSAARHSSGDTAWGARTARGLGRGRPVQGHLPRLERDRSPGL